MATKTNLLTEINSNTGTMLTFQQYADDLTKQLSDFEGWRVVPSKYIAVKLSSKVKDGKNTIPTVLQNYFENKVACLKDKMGEKYNADICSEIFWSAMEKLIDPFEDTHTSGSIPSKYSKSICYIGDINVTSERGIDGQTYSEIYVYIPEDAPKTEYGFVKSKNEATYEINEDSLHGWDTQYPSNATLENSPIYDNGQSYTLKDTYVPCFDSQKTDDYYINLSYALDKSSFDFDAIVVLYDIKYNNDGKIVTKHTGVPMGIYLLPRAITKFVSNDDIYGQGTAYGFRLNSKFVSQPAMTKLSIEQPSGEDNLDSITAMLAEYSEASKKMMKIVDTNAEHLRTLKDNLSMFRNYRVNVPYQKQVNNELHWFVNGRDVTEYARRENETSL